jgi:hypothetical protein
MEIAKDPEFCHSAISISGLRKLEADLLFGCSGCNAAMSLIIPMRIHGFQLRQARTTDEHDATD